MLEIRGVGGESVCIFAFFFCMFCYLKYCLYFILQLFCAIIKAFTRNVRYCAWSRCLISMYFIKIGIYTHIFLIGRRRQTKLNKWLNMSTPSFQWFSSHWQPHIKVAHYIINKEFYCLLRNLHTSTLYCGS